MARMNPLATMASSACAVLLWVCVPLVSQAAEVQAGTFEVLARFDPDGCRQPSSPLTQGLDGNFYGTMAEGGSRQGGCLYQVAPTGQIKLVHEFDAFAPEEGMTPWGSMSLGADGTLIGTTQFGGGPTSGGTVFRATTEGAITYLQKFGQNPLTFKHPTGAPIKASDGRLYGSISHESSGNLGGLVYSMREDGSDLRVLHKFELRRPGDVVGPTGQLMQGADGALYGALLYGPLLPDGGVATDGAIFRLALNGDYRVLHTDYVVGDGTFPQGSLVQTADGALYGTNSLYGGDGYVDLRGTIFRLWQGKSHTVPKKFKVLFTGSEFGTGPRWLGAPLTPMPDGSLWSVSVFGGTFGWGTVYRFTADGDMRVVHSFTGGGGSIPFTRLTLGSDGWLYGITQSSVKPGGAAGGAVVFRIRPD